MESEHVLEMSNYSIVYVSFKIKCVHIVESNGTHLCHSFGQDILSIL